MPAADMTPEREEQLTADLLRERVGVDPGNAGQLADLAAIGLVNGAWRNTCVERTVRELMSFSSAGLG
jgi:hypothetical protein